MEYQRIIDLLDNTPNQPTKFRTEDWVEINDESQGTYDEVVHFYVIKAIHTLVKGTAPVVNTVATPPAANNHNKKVIFKNSIHVLIPMYNLIKFSDSWKFSLIL